MSENVRYVGHPVPRRESHAKVRGRQLFMNDISTPDALWAKVIRSPHARADVLAVDPNRALSVDGVVAVFTADEMPDVTFNTAASAPSNELTRSADRRLLTNNAQHVGDAVAVIAATSRKAAEAAAQLVDIDWQVLAPELDLEGAYRRGKVLGRIRRLCADILGMPMTQVRIVKLDEGGGFGCKQELYEEALVGWLALRLQRPVQLRYSRLEEFTASRTRHAAIIHVQLGLRSDGKLLACNLSALVDSGAYASHTPYVIGDLGAATVYTYPGAAHHFQCLAVQTNKLPGGAYRGFGAPQANFAVEQTRDIAARRLRIDPVELRLLNGASREKCRPSFWGRCT